MTMTHCLAHTITLALLMLLIAFDVSVIPSSACCGGTYHSCSVQLMDCGIYSCDDNTSSCENPRDSKGYPIIIDDPDCVSAPVIVYARVTSVVTLNSTSPPMEEYQLPRKRYSLYLIHVFRSTIADYVQVDKKASRSNISLASVVKYYTGDYGSVWIDGVEVDRDWDHADINLTFVAGETAYLVADVDATSNPYAYCDFNLTVGMEYLLRPNGFIHSNCYAHDSRARITNSSNEVYMTDLGVCFPYKNYENPSAEFLLELATECGRDYNLTHLVQRQQARDALYFASQEG